jgi:hypothetical protein
VALQDGAEFLPRKRSEEGEERKQANRHAAGTASKRTIQRHSDFLLQRL